MRLLLYIIALILCSSPAQATTIDGALLYKSLTAQADIPTPHGHVRVLDQRCPSPNAGTCAGGRVIFMNPAEAGNSDVAMRFYHELGHEFDFVELTRADRSNFRQAVGLQGRWRAREAWDGYEQPPMQEVFAEAYAMLASNSGPGISGAYRVSFSAEQLSAARSVIEDSFAPSSARAVAGTWPGS